MPALTISPTAEVRWLYDVFGNSVAAASFAEPADELYFQSVIVIERYPLTAPEFAIEPFARTLPFSYPAREIPDLGTHHRTPLFRSQARGDRVGASFPQR